MGLNMSKKEYFEGKKVALEVQGTSTINHKARRKMNIDCNFYVFLDFIIEEINKKRIPTIEAAIKKIGFDEKQLEKYLTLSFALGYLKEGENNMPINTGKWDAAFDNINKEFNDLFWKKDGNY
jgi:hypothetical protein